MLVVLMLFSIVVNWLVGRWLSKTEGTKKKIILSIGVIVDLLMLGYFKYAGFFCFNSQQSCW